MEEESVEIILLLLADDCEFLKTEGTSALTAEANNKNMNTPDTHSRGM
jgi:hypothetical protein